MQDITHGDLVIYLMAMEERMKVETMDNLLFRRFFGDVAIDPQTMENGQIDYDYLPSGKIVEHYTAFAKESTDYLQIPMEMNLEQEPGYGSQYMVGTGEELVNKFMRTYINEISGVVKKRSSTMSKLRNDQILKHFERALPALKRWFGPVMNMQFISALYEGHSLNCTTGLTNAPDGIGVSGKFHPNMYYNKVSASAGTGTIEPVGTEYYTKTEAEVDAAMIDAYADITAISPYFFDKLKEVLTKLHIEQTVDYKGNKLWAMVVSLEEISALNRNAAYRQTVERVMYKNLENPLYSPEAYVYGGFMLIVDRLTTRKWYKTATDKGNFAGPLGYRGQPTASTSANSNILTVLGKSSIGYANPFNYGLTFIPEDHNFRQIKEIAGLLTAGVSRGESVAKADIATFYVTGNETKTMLATAKECYNTGSLQIAVKVA